MSEQPEAAGRDRGGPSAGGTGPGQVVALWRYPVKSMQGETIGRAEVTAAGVVGDRAWAVIDASTGQVASAKHPRKWGALLGCSARTVAGDDGAAGAVEITLPDSTVVRPGAEAEQALSALLGREVILRPCGQAGSSYEGVWPELEGLAPEAFVAATRIGDDEQGALLGLQLGAAAPGTFLDVAALHIVATSSLERLRVLVPEAEIGVRRFRPNVVVDWPTPGDRDDDPGDATGAGGFVEDGWAGQSLSIGLVEATGSMPTMRCIMTTLAQPDLPARPEVLRGLAAHHRVKIGGGMWACLGLYADVRQAGSIAVGDPVRVTGGIAASG